MWCYSRDGEHFEGEFETKKDAIAEAIFYLKEEDDDRDYIYIGISQEIGLGVNASQIIEDLQEQAYDQAGDYADSFLTRVPREQEELLEARMNEVLHDWLKDFNHKPNFWTVVDVEKIRVRGDAE
ncbi:hypothetical protein [Bacillus phage vB_BanS-Thrax3]|nr:hypothetical protein [Bacillus phage vB_BanS-Thrax3]